jgi:hypothetical protein
MKVEIDDDNAYRHQIDSADPELIGRWFAEKAKLLMSANAMWGNCRMRIWPSTNTESKTIGQGIEARFTQDSLLSLAGQILEASKMLGDLESAAARHER